MSTERARPMGAGRRALRGAWALAAVAAGIGSTSHLALGQGRPEGQPGVQQTGRVRGEGMGRGLAGPGGRFGGMGGFGQNPSINDRQLSKYLDLVSASEAQRESAKALMEGYRDQIETLDDAAREKRRELGEKMREGPDPELFAQMRTEMEKSRAARDKAEKAFLGDVRALLTPEQASSWPRVERAVRRDQGMSRGFVSGERLDVIRVVEEAGLAPGDAKAMAPTLDSYEQEVDRAIVERDQAYEAARTAMGEAMRNGEPEAADGAFEKGRAAAMKLRDINRKYARQVLDQAPEGKKAAMELAIKRANHPEVYRETPTDRRLAAAEKLAGLDASQQSALQALREKHGRERELLNDQLAAAMEAQEANFNPREMMGRGRRGGGPGGGDGEGPFADLREKRRELERSTGDALKGVLKPEQMEQLPQAMPGESEDGDRPLRRTRDRRAPGGAPPPNEI